MPPSRKRGVRRSGKSQISEIKDGGQYDTKTCPYAQDREGETALRTLRSIRTPEEQQVLDEAEAYKGRKLTPQEEALALDQSRMLGVI